MADNFTLIFYYKRKS